MRKKQGQPDSHSARGSISKMGLDCFQGCCSVFPVHTGHEALPLLQLSKGNTVHGKTKWECLTKKIVFLEDINLI